LECDNPDQFFCHDEEQQKLFSAYQHFPQNDLFNRLLRFQLCPLVTCFCQWNQDAFPRGKQLFFDLHGTNLKGRQRKADGRVSLQNNNNQVAEQNNKTIEFCDKN
jgi:hypothetical protein